MYGRGGAGNIAQAAASSKKAAEDTEAANPPSTTPSAPSQTSSTASQDYAHMGRGGAGNWFQPKALQAEGTFSQQTAADATAPPPTTASPNVSKPWTPEGQELPVARQGRGGAGNMVWKSEEMWRREKEDERRRREEIERSAAEAAGGLQSPGKAVFSAQKGGRGW